MKATNISRKLPGNGTNLKILPRGTKGNNIARKRIIAMLIVSNLFGLLPKKGTTRVRMTKMTRVWVKIDSTNHADWNKDGLALKT